VKHIIQAAGKSLAKRIQGMLRYRPQHAENSLALLGKLCAESNRRLNSLNALSDAEFRVHSQWGEDGIIEWLVQRLPIRSKKFIEFGVESYIEANTRFLLEHRDWMGLVIDGSARNIRSITSDNLSWRHDLTAACAFVTKDNINDLLRQHGFTADIGILSIDIDGNDYWVWRAIDVINPAIVVCEYNAVFGDIRPITVPYKADFSRSLAHHSNLYFGCSIKALCKLAETKGYTFLGSNSAGCNAFFVRDDLAANVRSAIADTYPRSSRARESRNRQGQLTFLNGLLRSTEIQLLPVVDLDNGQVSPLRDLGKLYSDRWLDEMGAQDTSQR
jgi:hypothetical protein